MASSTATVDWDGTNLVLRFPFDPALKDALKDAVPRRRWDPDAKAWTAPRSSSAAVLKFASDNGFVLTDAVLNLPDIGRPAAGIWQEGPALLIRFPFSPEMVADIKQIAGRKWDKERKVWRAPITSIRQVRAFGEAHGLDLSALDAVPDAVPVVEPTIVLHRNHFRISFPYDRDLYALVRDIPTARQDAGAWLVDTLAVLEVAMLIRDRGALVDEGAAAMLEAAAAELAQVEASRAADADLSVPTLAGELMPFQRAGVAYALRALGYRNHGGRWIKTCESGPAPLESGTVSVPQPEEEQ